MVSIPGALVSSYGITTVRFAGAMGMATEEDGGGGVIVVPVIHVYASSAVGIWRMRKPSAQSACVQEILSVPSVALWRPSVIHREGSPEGCIQVVSFPARTTFVDMSRFTVPSSNVKRSGFR